MLSSISSDVTASLASGEVAAETVTRTIDKRIVSGADDVEQRGSKMSRNSTDLDLVVDGAISQQVGLRFTALDIPPGAVITAAYIQFTADERGSGATSLLIQGLDSDDASPFTSISNNLSSRPTTSASATWQPQAWTIIDEAGAAQRTPDLSALVQEIIDRAGWQAGNDLAFVISGSGKRTADAFEGGAAKAPLLHIEYTLADSNAPPVLDLDASATGVGYATMFSENGAAVPIADSDAIVTDSDDSSMERLTVTITNAKAGDQLLVVGTLPTGITVDPGSTATNLILAGSAPIASYQAALQQLRFNATGTPIDPAARQIQVTIFDGQTASSPAVATVMIDPANIAPVLDLDGSAAGLGYSTLFSPDGGAVPIADSDLLITDSDDTNMERLTVAISNAKAGDQLLMNGTLPAGIAIDPSSTLTTLILTGSASIAAYELALEQVRFDNGGATVDPTARQVQVTVSDGQATSSQAIATVAIDTGTGTVTIDKRIASGADDVEQVTANGNMLLTSSDLDLVVAGTAGQQVGLRFTALDIPAGAVITAAYIQFQTDERTSVATSLLIRGLDSDDASPFTNRYFDLSSRLTTSASVSWQPPAWTIIDEAGAAQRTPDLSALVQAIVNRSGWQAGNDLAFVISGSGTRTADAFEGGAAKAPLLHIEYRLSSPNAGEIVLDVNQAFRENVAGATAGTLSVANPEPGQSYTFSVADARFEIVGNELKLKEGIRLDFERAPSVSLDITATASGGGSLVDSVTAPVIDVLETRFAAFGDYGNNAGAAAVAQLVNSLAVDFIITTGDNMYGQTPIDDQIGNKYSSYIGNYQGTYGPGSATNRFWPSLGNHEYSGDGGGVSAYRDYFTLPGNELYYDFVIGPVHFFAIDSNPEQPDGRSSTSVQAQWLQSELAASTSPYKIVFFHHPPYSSGTTHGSSAIMRWPFEEWGATAVLSAHEHVYERIHRDDNLDGTILPYFITGLGGASRYTFGTPVEGSQVRFADNWGTMLIQASDDSITFDFIAVTGGGSGTLIDSYTIDLPVSALQAGERAMFTLDESAMFPSAKPAMFAVDSDPNFGAPLFRSGPDLTSTFDYLI